MATAARSLDEIPRSTSRLVTLHRGGVEVIDRWADDWRELCDDAVDDQPFYRPEWIAAHIRAFTPEAKVMLCTVTIAGRLCLVLPLLEERSLFCGIPVRKLCAPVNGHSCRFDALRRCGLEGGLAVQALWQHLKSLAAWDVLEFEGIPDSGTLSALALATEDDGFQTGQIAMSPNPYVPISGGLPELPDLPINRKLRSQLRGIRGELVNAGELRLRRVGQADRAVLQRFYDLESAGWKGRDKTAIASSAQCMRFYDEISRAAEQFGYLSVCLLEWNDQLLAAHFGLSYKGRYFSPKVAYDENLGKWAPGHLIVEEILRDCAVRGIHEYDITGQNDPWKRKWTSQTRGQCVQYIFGKGVAGQLANLMRFRVRQGVKKILTASRPFRTK
jgi:CelD/BcsL family acetyltransferase involved in cellulose biosynthesis